MTVPTQPVTIILADFGGPAIPGVLVKARLSNIDYTADGVFVGTEPVTGTTDATGTVVLQLFPNATVANGGLGTRGTTVRVTASMPGRNLNVRAVIPNQPCNLVDYLVDEEPNGLSASEAAAAAAQAARDAAAASALSASTSATTATNAATSAAASEASATSSAGAAANSAGTAASNARVAAAAYAQAVAYVNGLNVTVNRSTYTSDLLVGHSSGLVIDATQSDVTLAVQVVDTVTPANNYLGEMYGFLASNTFTSPRLCKQSDGTFKWQDHNEALWSGDPSNAVYTKTNITPTTGQVGPDGTTTDGTLLTVSTSTTNPRISQTITVLANRYRRQEVVVKAGTAPFIYIEVLNNAVTRRAWFNTSTLAWATVDAGLTTAGPYTTKEDGTAWATGWRSIAAYGSGSGGTSDQVRIGLSDTDGGTTCTLGRTVTIAHLQSHRGVKRLPYLATTTAAVQGIPYDWTPGERMVRVDGQVAYKARSSNDLTNATFWTATNVTAALDTTGPDGEPCSSITATAANGTISQAVTSSGTIQTSFAWIRRRTGTGTLEMSVNNGSSYTNITGQVGTAGGQWGLVYIKSTVANPTVVFRIGTSGDAFEVWCFNVSQTSHVPAPYPSALIDYTQVTDLFSIPTTRFNVGTSNTFYADLYYPADAMGAAGLSGRVGFYGAGSLIASVSFNSQPTFLRLENVVNDGTAYTRNFGNHNNGGRIQIQYRVQPGNHGIAYNGEFPWWNLTPIATTYTSFKVNPGQCFFLRRLLVVPEAISDDTDALRLWHLDQDDTNVSPYVLSGLHVYKKGSDANIKISRIPTAVKLYERGDIAGIGCFWGEIHNPGWHAEHPHRAVMRRYEFDRSKIGTVEALYSVSDRIVIYEPALWASDLGTAQGHTAFKIEKGPYKGRLCNILCVEDSVSGTSSDDARNLYILTSDNNGDTWTTKFKILDKSVFLGSSNGFVCTGENGSYFQITDPDDPHFGRVYVSLNMNNTLHYAMWTDDFCPGGNGTGHTWSYSTTPVNGTAWGGGTLSEPAITHWPNWSTIVLLFRNSGAGDAAYAISTDYGVTFSAPALLNGDNITTITNCGLLQSDPEGSYGRYGRILYQRSTIAGRLGNKIQISYDGGVTFLAEDNLYVIPGERVTGYCAKPIKLFHDDTIYGLFFEVKPTTVSASDESQFLGVVRLPT